MIVLFPSFPFDPKRVAPGFEAEAEAAREAGFRTAYVDAELNSGSPPKFFQLPTSDSQKVLYRGWLMRPKDYERVHAGILDHGHVPVTSLEDYLESYEFPRWYNKLAFASPQSLYFTGSPFTSPQSVVENLPELASVVGSIFGDRSIIVKDFIKSRKHEWFDACFIRPANDYKEFARVVTNFVNGQGEDLTGGLVFREFIEFKRAGIHLKSRMPLIQEWRLFVWEHEVLYHAPYWANATYNEAMDPPQNWLADVIRRMQSPFFVLDLAQRVDGSWMIMEVNDAGAAGIPENGSAEKFYKQLSLRLGSLG